jgi:hypothetical protein
VSGVRPYHNSLWPEKIEVNYVTFNPGSSRQPARGEGCRLLDSERVWGLRGGLVVDKPLHNSFQVTPIAPV